MGTVAFGEGLFLMSGYSSESPRLSNEKSAVVKKHGRYPSKVIYPRVPIFVELQQGSLPFWGF